MTFAIYKYVIFFHIFRTCLCLSINFLICFIKIVPNVAKNVFSFLAIMIRIVLNFIIFLISYSENIGKLNFKILIWIQKTCWLFLIVLIHHQYILLDFLAKQFYQLRIGVFSLPFQTLHFLSVFLLYCIG